MITEENWRVYSGVTEKGGKVFKYLQDFFFYIRIKITNAL